MSTTPAEQVAYSFVTANSAVTYSIPQWIIQKSDIAVYFGTTLQSASNYTTTNITDASYTLTFSTAPADGTTVFIFRTTVITQPTDYSAGEAVTSTDLNSTNDQVFLQAVDADYRLKNLSLQYDKTLLTTSGTITDAMLDFPVPTTPGTGESNYVMAWTGTKWVSEQNNQSGVSAAELEAALADSTAGSEGSSKIGYSGDASTVEGQLDIFRETATGENASGSTYITAWNFRTSQSQSVQAIFNALMKNATSATNSGAYYLSYWDGDGNETIQQALDSRRAYGIGDFIAGLPFENPQTGSWLTIKASDTIGSAASTATKKSDDYQALYVYMKVHYEGETEANATAAFTANTVLQPSAMTSNPVAGVNTWRYA